jgi:hypothetical protein
MAQSLPDHNLASLSMYCPQLAMRQQEQEALQYSAAGSAGEACAIHKGSAVYQEQESNAHCPEQHDPFFIDLLIMRYYYWTEWAAATCYGPRSFCFQETLVLFVLVQYARHLVVLCKYESSNSWRSYLYFT